MARNLILLTTSILIFLSYSCCKQPKHQYGIKPLYEIQLPTGTSAEIYYNGLYTMPMYKDWIIAHTSIADDGIFREDNRLCAVNIKNKQVDWFFPINTNKRSYCAFDGKGYLYKNKLVFRYIKDFNEMSESNRTTVCLNLDTNEILWEVTEDRDLSLDGKDLGNGEHVIGYKGKCFFVENEKDLIIADLDNNSHTTIYNSGEEFIHDLLLTEDNKFLVMFCYKYNRNEDEYSYDNRIRILDINSLQITYSREISPLAESGHFHFAASGCENDGIIYVNIDTFITAINWEQDIQLWEREDYWAYIMMDMNVFGNTLLKCGRNATIGYNIHSGDVVYDYRDHGSLYTSFDGPYAYMVTAGEKLEIIDIESGNILDTVTCPYRDGKSGFIGSYPSIHGDKMYIMGCSNKLFCYPKYPW